MAVDLIIRGGSIVSPTHIFSGSLAIEEGKIVAVGDETYLPPANKVVDAQGKYVLPGIVDPHFHPSILGSYEDSVASETRAAAAGGVTTIGLFLPLKARESILEKFEYLKKGYEDSAIVDSFFHAPVRGENALGEISRSPEVGITSFKFSFGYKGVQAEMLGAVAIDDGVLYEGFEEVAKLGYPGRAAVHAENIDIALRLRERLIKAGRKDFPAWNDSRPNFVEAECMRRCIFLAGVTGCPLYIVHTTIGEGVDIVKEARADGVNVVAETCPQYLTHNSEEPIPLFKDHPALGNVNPPLRDKASNERLWQGIRDGVISCIGSDQALSTRKQKGNDIWNAPMGMGNTTEMILPVMLSEGVNKGRITLPKVVEVCCANPARVFGIYPKKGTLSVGADADVVIVDPKKKVRVSHELLHSACDWSIYEGWEFTRWPVATFLRGQLIVENGTILAQPGFGQYLPRQTA